MVLLGFSLCECLLCRSISQLASSYWFTLDSICTSKQSIFSVLICRGANRDNQGGRTAAFDLPSAKGLPPTSTSPSDRYHLHLPPGRLCSLVSGMAPRALHETDECGVYGCLSGSPDWVECGDQVRGVKCGERGIRNTMRPLKR